MIKKTAITLALLLAACSEVPLKDEAVSYEMLCGPTLNENTSLYISTDFFVTAIEIESDEVYEVIDLIEYEGGADGNVSIPFFNCSSDFDVSFLYNNQ